MWKRPPNLNHVILTTTQSECADAMTMIFGKKLLAKNLEAASEWSKVSGRSAQKHNMN